MNANYGTADDLLALSVALHDRDMYLMVDVVANHMVISKLASCYQGSNSDHRDTMEQEILLTIVSLIPLTLRHISTRTVLSATTTIKLMLRIAG